MRYLITYFLLLLVFNAPIALSQDAKEPESPPAAVKEAAAEDDKPVAKPPKREKVEKEPRSGFDAKSGGLGALVGSIMTLITRALFGGGNKKR